MGREITSVTSHKQKDWTRPHRVRTLCWNCDAS